MNMPTATEQIREDSLWFGTADRPMFGRLTTPVKDTALGAILLSSPIGRESRLSRRALRSLAILLARGGYASLRYDHVGSGDSSGSVDDEEIGDAWISGIDQGVALLRTLGIDSVSAVGMRMGATIIGAACSSHDLGLSSLVMWDPCETGRAYVRELDALGALQQEVLTAGLDNSTKMLEYPLSDETADRISRFTLRDPATRPLAQRVLVVVRDDRPVSNKFRERWETDQVEWTTTSEQGPMLETQLPTSVLPSATITEIHAWLTSPESSLAPFSLPSFAREAIVTKESNTHSVRERVVELGPRKLFGVMSAPVGEVTGPLIVMVNGANEDHVGPARLWVELSRSWAGSGLQCIRFDLSERGESPWFPEQPDRPTIDDTRPQDVIDAIQALDPVNPADSVLIAYCSGAPLAFDVLSKLDNAGLCAINPGAGNEVFRTVNRAKNSRRETVQALMRRVDSLLKTRPWADVVFRRVSWLMISLSYVPRVRSALVRSGSNVLLLLSAEDLPQLKYVPAIRRRLGASGFLHLEVVPGMDHAILSTVGRRRAVDILKRHIVETFADGTGHAPPA
jgi:pimeloyl-ACP methyl ester carboxylesterase